MTLNQEIVSAYITLAFNVGVGAVRNPPKI